jgi:cellulose biosynthesis protein BcsQ
VIAVASEKGGVGKTTIATNLAVYLKALREDLPVTIASFDNHFSVDQMFALGPRPQSNISDLLGVKPEEGLAVLGQYGVQYVASSRRLQQPSHAPAWLRQRLSAAISGGVLILDTRPVLDWFTEAALLAADLVLVPIKDRAALVNAGTLRKILAEAERADRFWLVPSLVDTRARLNAEVRVHEFLSYAARERDYQVLDLCISKSPKVEGLASGFSSRIRPVLTHARNTAVHGQFKQLAEFVLSRFDAEDKAGFGDRKKLLPAGAEPERPSAQRRRLVLECPLCCRQSFPGIGHFYFDLRSRRRGFIHPACFVKFCDDIGLDAEGGQESLLALTIDGPGLVGSECRLAAHLCDADGGLVGSEEINLGHQVSLAESLAMMTGRSLDEAYREFLLVSGVALASDEQLTEDAYRRFVLSGRHVARELRQTGLY